MKSEPPRTRPPPCLAVSSPDALRFIGPRSRGFFAGVLVLFLAVAGVGILCGDIGNWRGAPMGRTARIPLESPVDPPARSTLTSGPIPAVPVRVEVDAGVSSSDVRPTASRAAVGSEDRGRFGGMLLPMLSIFAAVAIVFFVAERIDAARPQKVFRKGFLTDLLYCVSSVGIRTAMTGTLAIGFTELGRHFLPGYSIGVLRDQPVWIQSVSIILVFDLIFYVLHRAKHHWRWLWRLHETHHSSAELDWFSSVRFHPLEKLFDRSIYLFPLLFLGVSEPALLILAAFDATIASFSHANLNWRIGPLIYVFVGPEMHRWHHSTDPRRQRCNFGNNLSIFDWIFGTAFLSEEHPVSFGLGNPRFPEGHFLKQFLYAFRPFPRRRPPVPSAVTVPRSGIDDIPSPATQATAPPSGTFRGSESAVGSCR